MAMPQQDRSKVSGSVVAGFPSPAEQYQETPLDLNELLVKRPAATVPDETKTLITRISKMLFSMMKKLRV